MICRISNFPTGQKVYKKFDDGFYNLLESDYENYRGFKFHIFEK